MVKKSACEVFIFLVGISLFIFFAGFAIYIYTEFQLPKEERSLMWVWTWPLMSHFEKFLNFYRMKQRTTSQYNRSRQNSESTIMIDGWNDVSYRIYDIQHFSRSGKNFIHSFRRARFGIQNKRRKKIVSLNLLSKWKFRRDDDSLLYSNT